MSNIQEMGRNHIRIFDTTSRDGYQTAGANVDLKGRMETAHALARLNVDIIEAGFPGSNAENAEAVRAVAAEVHGPIIAGLARATNRDIDICWEAIESAPRRRIHTFISTSPVHMKYKLGKTPTEVIALTREAVTRARGYTSDVEFSAEDAYRSDFGFMMRVFKTAIDAGATTINAPDTVGYADPDGYKKFIAKIIRSIDTYIGANVITVSAHCHDDLGLATANTLAAIQAGARQIEVTVNGIGERAGNTSLEQVLAAMYCLPNVYKGTDGTPLSTHVDLQQIAMVSEVVARVSRLKIQANTPIVGSNAFAHEAGIHADGMLKHEQTYQIVKPEIFGFSGNKIVIGAETGYTAIASRAKEMELNIEQVDRMRLTEEVKKQANAKGGPLADTELEHIFAHVIGEQLSDDAFTLAHVAFQSDNEISEAHIILSIDGQAYPGQGKARGPIDAAVQAIKQITGLDIEIIELSDKSLGEGAQAKAGSQVTIRVNGKKISGYAEDESVPHAAIKACVAALNTADRAGQRMEKAKKQTVVVFQADEAVK